MNPLYLERFSLSLCAILLGVLIIAIAGGWSYIEVPVETQTIEHSTESQLINGKLAFTRTAVGPGPERVINITNPDASGGFVLAVPSNQFPTEPAWSPSGTRLAYVETQTGQDIFAVSLDGTAQMNLTNTASPIVERNPSWSLMGKIAYEQTGGAGGQQIWVMNGDGSGQTPFPGITQPSPTGPAWSADGSKLAYSTAGEIWVVNADGGNPHPVTSNTSADIDPAWSPDGSKIVFAKGGSGISIINSNGTNETPLTTNGGTQPAWSPDGTKIAFTRNGINTMDADGGNQVRIVANTTAFPQCCDQVYENPAWQPVEQSSGTVSISGRVTNGVLSAAGVTINLSGTTNAVVTTDAAGNYQFSGLAFGGNYRITASRHRYLFTPPKRSYFNVGANLSGVNFEVLGVCNSGRCVKSGKIAYNRGGGGGDIWTMNPDGTGKTNITNNPATDSVANYSPDGGHIAFSTNRDGGDFEIYRMDADGGNPVRITNSPGSDSQPYYSPDGKSIVFVSERDGNSEIYKMNADGSSPIRLTNDAALDSSPAFSSDGNRIVFVRSIAAALPVTLWTMNADGSNQQAFPNAGIYGRPSYSPDGSKIIFTYGIDVIAQQIWTMNADGSNRTGFPVGRQNAVYSPDGAKVAFFCCFGSGPFAQEGVWTVDASGASSTINPLAFNNGENVPSWQRTTVPRTAFDFDGDGRSDQAIFRSSTTDWWHLSSIDNSQRASAWGNATDVLAPADYDGDLKTDHAVWRPSTGNFHILNSFDFTVRVENFGVAGDVPTGGDWDGDGRADVAVYRPGAQSVFYYRASMGNPEGNVTFISWGITGDKPVAGDFDGDSRTDAAIYRPSTGTWYVNRSADGQLQAVNFGLAADIPVPADYDSDGKNDFAVYRGGIWYLLKSATGFSVFQFGLAGDIPVPADYDGDGRADPAIFRQGIWWMLKSGSGVEAVAFGIPTDVPIQAAYVR